MATTVMPLLSFLLGVPLLGALALSLLPAESLGRTYRSLAAVVMAIALVVSLAIARLFDPGNAAPQLTEVIPWLEPLGLSYRLSVDGLSLPLLVLNNFLTLIALLATSVNLPRPRLYYPLVLLLNAGVSGAFLADNLLLFFLFYELELIPLYLLIAIWGGARRSYAATKFLIYTAISGVLLLAGFLGLVWLAHASSFDFDPQLSTLLPLSSQLVLLGLILVGFGIKIPLVPFHTWLPDAHVEASTPISVLLAGVLLKLGTYGLVRFGVQLFPQAWQVLAPGLATWAVVSVLYGSLMAIAQTDMKKMVAYSSIGHMGFVLLATATATPLSILAAIAQMMSHGLISALLFLLVGVVYEKTGSRNIEVLRGLLNPERGLPLVGSLMIVGVMASGGIPGMVGFVAEFLIFRSSFLTFPVQTLLCMVGTGLTAVYFLLLVNRVFFGRLPNELTDLPPVAWGDRLPSLLLATLILILGIVPNWLIHWSKTTVSLLTTAIATLPAP
ncbi:MULTISPECIES: NADH-quinone oxidoreductase subunit M [unclassified Thermosynechococcus]|uniref:NADH-quinone oxidoreductase subunit M n=1 Tax=unclassified Thermosynechococcus TaxID=2622553 RepID=UPI0019FF5295|nr:MULTISPECIES: NADH-quinone oxidoreductase subunit M [unclassified Thermosynechococcus]HIK34349.1 NADH-quinone oxidoreductase subunit M [Thermosynechococcus sp. M98_K2018_005]HIK48027.1 NADH-quinone oxidoreductase subunit M [Thermosynechococcus sp. M55_K2018_012]